MWIYNYFNKNFNNKKIPIHCPLGVNGSPWIQPLIIIWELPSIVQSIHCWMGKLTGKAVLSHMDCWGQKWGWVQVSFPYTIAGSWRGGCCPHGGVYFTHNPDLPWHEERAQQFIFKIVFFFFSLLPRPPGLSLWVGKEIIPQKGNVGRCSSGNWLVLHATGSQTMPVGHPSRLHKWRRRREW